MERKYELTENFITLKDGRKLYQIKALKGFECWGIEIKKGDLGGFIENENNLSHRGNCWVFDSALVYDNAKVHGNARVYDAARVYNAARIYDDAMVSGTARVYGNVMVYGNSRVCGNARVYNAAQVYNDAWVYGNSRVCGNARVYNAARIYDDAMVSGTARVYDTAIIFGNAPVSGNVRICHNAEIKNKNDYYQLIGFVTDNRNITFFKCSDGIIGVVCGCFHGTLDEFRTRVRDTRDGKIAKECLMLADLMELHFKIESEMGVNCV